MHILAEHHATLQFRGGIVEVDDRLVGALQRFEGAGDQFRTALHQHLQGNVLRHIALLHAPAGKIEVRLRSGRKTDLDFLEAHFEQQLEHAGLAVVTHGVDQRLVAVTQVHRTPDRRLVDGLARPCTVRNIDGRVRAILHARVRHALGNIGDLAVHFASSLRSPRASRAIGGCAALKGLNPV
ncbi:hypothetical protein D3C87_1433110 [compost metagenome]